MYINLNLRSYNLHYILSYLYYVQYNIYIKYSTHYICIYLRNVGC